MKILVIEDEKEIYEMISRVLERNGYAVKIAPNLLTAVNCINKEDWDLIITDIMIPHSGGFELVENIKSKSSTTPVIIITGMSESVLSSTVTKADVIIHKPFSGYDLIDAIKNLTQ